MPCVACLSTLKDDVSSDDEGFVASDNASLHVAICVAAKAIAFADADVDSQHHCHV